MRTNPTPIVTLALVVLTGAAPAQAAPVSSENAALWYWQAINAWLDEPRASREATLELLENPGAADPDRLRETLERLDGMVLERFLVGAGKPSCTFGIDRDRGLGSLLPHLARMRFVVADELVGDLAEELTREEAGHLVRAYRYIDLRDPLVIESLLDEGRYGRVARIFTPALVEDRTAGRLFVFISRSPLRDADGEPLHELGFYTNIQETRRLGRAWFLAWSAPVEITSQLIEVPHWQEWSPVHVGVQLREGTHAGRLVVPCRIYCPDADPSPHDLYETGDDTSRRDLAAVRVEP